jgi:hypothetical protein
LRIVSPQERKAWCERGRSRGAAGPGVNAGRSLWESLESTPAVWGSGRLNEGGDQQDSRAERTSDNCGVAASGPLRALQANFPAVTARARHEPRQPKSSATPYTLYAMGLLSRVCDVVSPGETLDQVELAELNGTTYDTTWLGTLSSSTRMY